ncbi:hypothetical protein GCM10010305_62880 [Streptomyces termitum]|uniref:Uncharacterized protein n=1 Tax=Streptomyces termitum TaxID=67368 RepID=A0A918TB66_9ACTN|nr:hypothetical protein GCM10010305_62880 [Streptomyces termitum]
MLLADGGEERARTVVVATGQRAAELLPGLRVPGGRTVTTLYHAAVRPPLEEPVLVVDSRRRFLDACVPTSGRARSEAPLLPRNAVRRGPAPFLGEGAGPVVSGPGGPTGA